MKRVIRSILSGWNGNSYNRKRVPDAEMVEPVTLPRNKMRTFLWYQEQGILTMRRRVWEHETGQVSLGLMLPSWT